jgi:CIC family chloride channel protein
MSRNNIELIKLVVASVLIGILSAFFGDTLKILTENYETRLFALVQSNRLYIILFPLTGLSIIHYCRQYLFSRKENKGIKEIYDSLKSRHNELPLYKIPSHFINGLLTVVFGGSTGIEVSTVVASASIGSVAQKKSMVHHLYRKELICAGVAAAVTALFNSPLAGAFFALEVILKKMSAPALISILAAVLSAWTFNYLLDPEPLFHIHIAQWHHYAFPYFVLLGILSGLNSVYLTRCVLFFKARFARLSQHFIRITLGSVILSSCLFLFPQLYGDGYSAMRSIFLYNEASIPSGSLLLMIAGLLLLKPVATSATLAAGGDGGVFAPSLFIGAFLGLLLAFILNTFFHLHVIPINFMVIGMGAVLSASLHAPFTALFLVCGLANDYTLLIPALAACFAAKITAKMIMPYTVYNYAMVKAR